MSLKNTIIKLKKIKSHSYWKKKGLFKPKKIKTFSIVIPPPNITENFIWAMLNNSLQDVLVRFTSNERSETLWQPGTDHAGIATQALVEKHLKKNINKEQIGRENSLKKSGNGKRNMGKIINQLKN